MASRDDLPRGTHTGRRQARARSRAPPSKARERVLLVCAGLIILFAPSDVYALGHFNWGPLIVRLEWAGSVLVTVLALRKVEPHGVPIILNALAILSTVLYGALAWLTGGTNSPLFHWILALPIVIAVVLPDLPAATVGCGAVLVLYGGLLLGWAGEPLAGLVRWMAQAVVVTSLVYTVSATYRRLRMRETPPPDAQDVAAARVRASEAAVAARDEFLAVAAHELRTPLTSMLLHIEAIERTLPMESAPEIDDARAADRAEADRGRRPPGAPPVGADRQHAGRLEADGRPPVARAGRGRRDRAGPRDRAPVHARRGRGRLPPDAAPGSTHRRRAGRDPPGSDHRPT